MVWWEVFWKKEICGFWDVKVGMASKCPQMNTMKNLVDKSFELCWFWTLLGLAVWHDLARWLGGEFCEKKMKFVVFEVWRLELPTISPNEYYESLGARKFSVAWVFHMANLAVWHDTTRWLGGEFCEKMKFFVFEMWRLEWPPNAPKWTPRKSLCTKVLSCMGFAHAQVLRCGTT